MLRVEKGLNHRIRSGKAEAWGEDIKVMGVRTPKGVELTVACALIGKHVADMNTYMSQKNCLKAAVFEIAREHYSGALGVTVNAADDPAQESIYLTVTGTSAEAGDDGEVGRGNRGNGLITPHRPMSLEALAGKNPVSHVGKLYNAVAHNAACALVAEIPEIAAAECYLISRIGAPVTQPAVIDVRLQTRDGQPASDLASEAQDILRKHINCIPGMLEDFIEGRIGIV